MSCSGCAHNVEEMLSEIEGVVSANVDIVTGTAQVEMKEHISNDKPKKLRGAEAPEYRCTSRKT